VAPSAGATLGAVDLLPPPALDVIEPVVIPLGVSIRVTVVAVARRDRTVVGLAAALLAIPTGIFHPVSVAVPMTFPVTNLIFR
jgi:hypothetical protein